MRAFGERHNEGLSVEITRTSDITVAFVRHLYGYNHEIETAYKRLFRWLKVRGLLTGNYRVIGIPLDSAKITAPERCRYYAAVEVDGLFEPSGDVGKMQISGGLYAVVKVRNAGSDHHWIYAKVYGEWLPDSGYEPTGSFGYQVYYGNQSRRQKKRCVRIRSIGIYRYALCSLLHCVLQNSVLFTRPTEDI